MKEIMISIKPEYVEKILNSEKTIEIRKSKPSCELPCKVYIYCQKSFNSLIRFPNKPEYTYLINKFDIINHNKTSIIPSNIWNGKVVADFTLNRIDTLERDLNDWLPKNRYDISNELLKDMKLNQEQLWEYGQGKTLYAWHIDNLKIYNEPKELSDFNHWVVDCQGWCNINNKKENCYILECIKTPPSNWCYVETME